MSQTTSAAQGTFSFNQDQSRYEYRIGNETAFALVHQKGNDLYVDYVEAPPALRGTGAASSLMQHVANEAKAQKLEIVPICGYAAAWLQRHQKTE